MDRTHFCWSYALTLPVFVLMTCSDIIWRHRMYHLNQILPNKGNCILSEFHYHLELKNYAFGCLCFLVWFVKFCSSIWDTNSENTQLLCFIFIFYYFEMFRWYTVLNWFKFFKLSSSFNFVLSLLLIYLFIYVFFHPQTSPLSTRYEECVLQKEAAKTTAQKLSDKVSPHARLKFWGFSDIDKCLSTCFNLSCGISWGMTTTTKKNV